MKKNFLSQKNFLGSLLFSFLFLSIFFVSANTVSAQGKTPFQVLVPTAEMRTPLVENKDLDSCIQALLGDDDGQCSLDSLAWLLARALITAEFNAMMNMMQEGFFGDTAFLTDPNGYYRGINDEVTQDFLTGFDTTNMLPSVRNSIRAQILREQYSTYQDELEQGVDFPGGDAGLTAFLNNWDDCPTGNGWDCYEALQDPRNNTFLGQDIVGRGLAKVQMEGLDQSSEEISQGSGYFNLKDNCSQPNYHWVGCSAYTPGNAVQDQTNEYLATSLDELLAADELDETVFAVINGLYQVVTNWLGGQRLINV